MQKEAPLLGIAAGRPGPGIVRTGGSAAVGWLTILVAAAWLGLASCSPHLNRQTVPCAELGAALDELLATAVAGAGDGPGMMLHMDVRAIGFVWAGAVGGRRGNGADTLDTGSTLRIASNTKTWVAAAILRLVESGALELDAPVVAHVRPESVDLLRRGGYDPDRITVKMLLQHTSGLFDYAASPVFQERVLSGPGHRWTRQEQLELAMTAGAPYGEPGTVYAYSDTGYILLGEILETVTGTPMAEAVRRLLDPARHGITNTWFESLEPEPGGAPPRARQFMGSLEVRTIDASADLFGGGGLVSTLEDMARFYAALLRGEIFENASTLELMLEVSPQSLAEDGSGYGMGIGRVTYHGIVCHGHGGFWGTIARHCPDIDLTLTAAVTNTSGRAALAEVVASAIRLALRCSRDYDPRNASAGSTIAGCGAAGSSHGGGTSKS